MEGDGKDVNDEDGGCMTSAPRRVILVLMMI